MACGGETPSGQATPWMPSGRANEAPAPTSDPVTTPVTTLPDDPTDPPDPDDPPVVEGPAVCGDGKRQQGESCDDGNAERGDGCRPDCVNEELIGAGFSGGQCEKDADCAPAGSTCVLGVYGGSCVIGCDGGCADRAMPTTPETFCIQKSVYESRLGGALPTDEAGVCVAKCEFDYFPRTGCREGLHCERRPRPSMNATDEVCVPGPWSVGLTLADDGATVTGVADASKLAEPYASLLETSCNGAFGPLPAKLVRGLADAWLAFETPTLQWTRPCALPAGLGDRYGTAQETKSAFVLSGTRAQVNTWVAQALYGRAFADRAHELGPLDGSRVVGVKDGTAAYLYADAGERRHFTVVDDEEWVGLDSAAEPDKDYRVIRSSGTQRKGAQWGKPETITYVAELLRAHIFEHGTPLGVGDISLPLGGTIAGHGSHQLGVDADLYLLSYDGDDLDNPTIWVSSCSGSTCVYRDGVTNALEPIPRAGLYLETAAQHAYDFFGPTYFVQNDVQVLAPFRALPHRLTYLDASNVEAAGWPVHADHFHMRFGF